MAPVKKTTVPKKSAPAKMEVMDSPYSLSSLIRFINRNFSLILVGGLLFLAGFFVGSLWTENQLKTGGAKPAPTAGAAPTAPTAPSGPTNDELAKMPKVSDQDHIRGNSNAKVLLVEYSDLECPFCQRFHPTMKQVLDEYGDQVAWVWRHYPLSFHPSAQKAAETSECVAKLGGNDAFWQFIDLYFDTTDGSGSGVKEAEMAALAAQVGVSQSSVQNCLDTDEMAQKVIDQQTAGGTAGVSGTPGTILVTKDGKYEMISGALPFAQVKSVIDKYL